MAKCFFVQKTSWPLIFTFVPCIALLYVTLTYIKILFTFTSIPGKLRSRASIYCRRDMTELLLEAASNPLPIINCLNNIFLFHSSVVEQCNTEVLQCAILQVFPDSDYSEA
jgi:hypothetical protein